MTTTSYPARIGLVSIHGEVGRLIGLGQYLNGDGFTRWEHAFMDLGDGTLIQAEPGKSGAQIRPLSIYDGVDVYWCDGIYRDVPEIKKPIIARNGREFEGTPYSFLDYDALAAHRLHIPVPGLQGYIASTGHMICSQLVDAAHGNAGYTIPLDRRWAGYVTPGYLYEVDLYHRRWSTHTWTAGWESA